jgi:hypothetical protein
MQLAMISIAVIANACASALDEATFLAVSFMPSSPIRFGRDSWLRDARLNHLKFLRKTPRDVCSP